MWFNPSEMQGTTDPVANFAIPANYQPEIKEISEISNGVVIENEAPQLSKLAELATPSTAKTNVSCGQCLHFKCHNAHGTGSGYCLIGGDYGLWSESEHHCQKFDARIEIQDYVIQEGAITVTCYSPNGQAFEVEARDPEHAEWLQQMNPKRI